MHLSDDPSSTEKSKTKRKDAVAVAMAYEPETDSAPRVIAGGRGSVAEQILEIAFANGIKVREDADLAELLSAIELDDEIPSEAFAAVAEILIYVYKANGNWPNYLDDAFGGPAPNTNAPNAKDATQEPEDEDTSHEQ
jgi:flagellar biosynthesis protein